MHTFSRRTLITSLLGAGGLTMALRSDDLVDLHTVKPSGSAQPMSYRAGVIKAWNPITLENTIEVGGAELHNVPVLGLAEASSYEVGDVVGLMVVGSTWAIIGALVAPGSTQAQKSLSFLSRRTYTAEVGAIESRSSSSWGDLNTPGPEVEVLIGPSGKALVTVSAYILADTVIANPAGGAMHVAVSGASTINPPDTIGKGLLFDPVDAQYAIAASRQFLMEGLNPGINVFTAKYYAAGAGLNTYTFANRVLTVVAI